MSREVYVNIHPDFSDSCQAVTIYEVRRNSTRKWIVPYHQLIGQTIKDIHEEDGYIVIKTDINKYKYLFLGMLATNIIVFLIKLFT